MSVTHRAPLTGFGPMGCCGRTPYEVPDTDRVTGVGAVTCLGITALPAPPPVGNLREILAEVPPHGGQYAGGGGRHPGAGWHRVKARR